MSADTLFHELTEYSISISTALTFLLVFFRTPKEAALKPYRLTRWAVLTSFILVTILNIFEVFFDDGPGKQQLIRLDTLVISSFQFYLFSLTLIIMLDFKLPDRRQIFKDVLPVNILAIIGYGLFLTGNIGLLNYGFIGFGIYYVLLVYICSQRYLKAKANTIKKLDNYFSEETAVRLRWTRNTFLLLFFGCIFAFVSLFLDNWFGIFFTIFYTFFYVYFVINYLNFVSLFLDLEPAFNLTEEMPPREKSSKTTEQLESAIVEWERKRLYTEPGITIEQVASQLNTNRTYLSSHMNAHRDVSFKEWISALRIEEAKRLLKEHPEMPVSQIGAMVGIPDKSNFGRQFTREVGKSPQAWRLEQH